jgi:hypothetical protein
MRTLSFVLVVFPLLSAGAFAAEGSSARGGGNVEEADFVTLARGVLTALLDNRSRSAEILGLDPSEFARAIESTEVQCAYGPILGEMNATDKLAFFEPAKNSIFLRCPLWSAQRRAGVSLEQVVFHEYMRRLGKESADYRISSRLKEALQVDDDLGMSELTKIPLSADTREILLSLNRNLSPTLKAMYDLVKADLAVARRSGGTLATSTGVVYYPFYRNFNFESATDRGVLMVAKPETKIRKTPLSLGPVGTTVFVFPGKTKQLTFELTYGGLNSSGPNDLTYATQSMFARPVEPLVPYGYYYYLQNYREGRPTRVSWEPSFIGGTVEAPILTLPNLQPSWDFTADGEYANSVAGFLQVTIQEQTGVLIPLQSAWGNP